MNVLETRIKELKIISPKCFEDERGYFFESFNDKTYKEILGDIKFVQDNESYSKFGTLRGLHYQLPPFAQTKLVRVIKGEVLDIAVDIRKSSPTFGQYEAVILNDKNKHQFFIPAGFAHGFVVLSEYAIFNYKVDNYYNKESEGAIIWNDKTLNIDWRIEETKILLSPKDIIADELINAKLFP